MGNPMEKHEEFLSESLKRLLQQSALMQID